MEHKEEPTITYISSAWPDEMFVTVSSGVLVWESPQKIFLIPSVKEYHDGNV